MKIVIVLSALLMISSAEILSRCQVVEAIKDSILTKFTHYSVADWVCLAHHESQYNTTEIGHETRNGKAWASEYGIFQISSKWWCDDGRTPNSENGCGIACNELLSNNLKPSIECAAKIVAKYGMEAWSSWVINCKDKWIDYYTFLCF